MMEFTLSRVVLCACGIALLAVAMSVVEDTEDRAETEMDSETVVRIASMLDNFEDSVSQELTVNGWEVLPSADHVLRVGNNIVTLECRGSASVAYTSWNGELELTWTSSGTIVRSVAEGLGDAPDGVGEDVYLLRGVVDVGGGAGASVDSARDVERMGAVHS